MFVGVVARDIELEISVSSTNRYSQKNQYLCGILAPIHHSGVYNALSLGVIACLFEMISCCGCFSPSDFYMYKGVEFMLTTMTGHIKSVA